MNLIAGIVLLTILIGWFIIALRREGGHGNQRDVCDGDCKNCPFPPCKEADRKIHSGK